MFVGDHLTDHAWDRYSDRYRLLTAFKCCNVGGFYCHRRQQDKGGVCTSEFGIEPSRNAKFKYIALEVRRPVQIRGQSEVEGT